MAIGGDDASIGNGAQGREYSDLQDKREVSLKLPASLQLSRILTSLNMLLGVVWFGWLVVLD